MTDKNLTEVVVLLDRSGSMADIQTEVEAGYLAFLKEQREDKNGRTVLTLCQFDAYFDAPMVETIYEAKPIEEAQGLRMVPRGMTPLRDAFASTILAVGARLSAIPEEQRPGQVIFVVITDGKENASHHFSSADLKQKVKEQEAVYGWQFLYLGANVDAFDEAEKVGIAADNSARFGYNAQGVEAAFSAASAGVLRGKMGQRVSYSVEEKEALKMSVDAEGVPPTM